MKATGKLTLDHKKYKQAWGNMLYLQTVSENCVSEAVLPKLQEV